MTTLMLALALVGCDLWELDDDTGTPAACVGETILSEEDLPCICGRETVTELPYDECKCTVDGVLTCKDGSTDTGMWPTL